MAELTLTDVRPAPAELRRVSPAAHLHDAFATAVVVGPRAVAVRELTFLAMVGLRSEPGSGVAERITTTLGARLPTACGGVATVAGTTSIWLAPDEWLVVSDREGAELTRALVVVLRGEPGSAVELSANRTTLELSGPSARDVLEKGCPLDLHPRAFEAGSAYATTLGPVPVVLWKTSEQTFRVLVRSSFADYVGRWLVDAMAEYASVELR